MSKVRFAPDVKTHDGLCNRSRLLCDTVYGFFDAQDITTRQSAKLFVQCKITQYKMDRTEAMATLRAQLAQLVEKTANLDPTRGIPILEKGGSAYYTLTNKHYVFLRLLVDWITK